MATGLPTFAPIIQATVIFPYAQPDQQAGLRYYYIEGVLVLVGTFLYTVGHDSSFLEKQPGTEWLTNAQSRIPESWRPVTFDIWGASHQVFHIFVVMLAAFHLYGILSVFKWKELRESTLPARFRERALDSRGVQVCSPLSSRV